jgi:hypothetical protein
MAKLTAWLATLIGVLWVLYLAGAVNSPVDMGWEGWVVGLSFLIIGLGKLARNYKMMKKR